MKLVLFLVGCFFWAGLARWWQPRLQWRSMAFYAVLSLAFLSPSLLTSGTQVATDQLYRWRPWSETVEQRIVPSNPLLADPLLQMLPYRTLVRQRLLRGEAPLWTHRLGTGQPLLGNGQSAPFAPLHLAALPLEPLDAMAVAAGWQLFVGLVLSHCLMLLVGVRTLPATFSAVTIGLSCFSAVWLFYPLGMTAIWLPGLIAASIMMSRADRGGTPGLIVCFVAMAASGHPETVAHACLVLAVVAAALAISLSWQDRWRFLRRLGGAGLIIALLVVPILGPVVEALPDSQRMAALAVTPDAASAPEFQTRMLLPLVSPFSFGSPRDGNWSGPWNFSELIPVYAGLVPLLLAIFGAVWLWRRVAPIMLGGAAALLVAVGFEPVVQIIDVLPLLEHGAHGRLRFVWVLAVAVAAGRTLDGLVRREVSLKARLGLGCLALLLVVLVLASAPPAVPWQRGWWMAGLVGLFMLGVVAASPWRGRWLAAVAILAAVADLLLVGIRYNPALPAELRPSTPPVLSRLTAAAGSEPLRIAAEEWDFPANLPALYGFADPRGNDPMRPAGPADFVARNLEGSPRSQAWTRLRPGRFDFAALDFLAVRYLLTPHRRQMPPPWTLSVEDQGGKIWANPAARRLFFTEGGGGEVTSITPFSNGFRLAVRTDGSTKIVSSVSYAVQWRVGIDGRAANVEEIGDAFLGVSVPSGAEEVVFRYLPASWRFGLWTLTMGLTAAAVRIWIDRRRRRRPPAGQGMVRQKTGLTANQG